MAKKLQKSTGKDQTLRGLERNIFGWMDGWTTWKDVQMYEWMDG